MLHTQKKELRWKILQRRVRYANETWRMGTERRARFSHSQKKTTAANCSAQNVNHVFPRCTFSLVVRRYDSTQHTFTFFFSACFFTIFLPLIPSIHLREYKHTALFRVTVPSLLQEILFTLHQFFHSPRFCTMIIIPHHHQPAFVIVLYQRERTGCPQSVF